MAKVAVRQDFWHTSVGILAKRVVMQALVLAGIIVFQALMQDSVNWHDVLVAVRVQVAYVILSTLQTLQDPKIPNTTNETVNLKEG